MKKKVLALLMAVALTLGICVPAFGATVANDTEGHTYDAYQVFKGTQAEGDAALGDVEWGSGVKGVDLLSALQKKYDYFDTCETAADVANILAEKDDNCDEAKALAAVAVNNLTSEKTTIVPAESVDLAAGYWLIVDTTNPGVGDAKNAALLQVTNGDHLAISKKYDVPSVDKAIVEGSSIVKETDINIGDTVTFKLTAIMPSTLEGYDTYKVVFHDTLSKGLTYEGDLAVAIGGEDVTENFSVTPESPAASQDGTTSFTVGCDDVLELGAKAGSTIVVTYTAKLNSSAEIGNPGNPNKVYLEYSNDPNWSGSGTEPTGKTPEDQVVVFTYELDVTKVEADGDEKKLQGAEFVLYRGSGENTEYAKVVDGRLTGWAANKSEANTLTSDASGVFKVIGLDAGTYWLEETKAPAGYNLLEKPVKVVIAATLGEAESGTFAVTLLTISVADGVAKGGDTSTGVVSMTVENNKGVTLPETGGMGTMLFYIVGGVLVAGAAVLLAVRRRTAGSEE